MDDCISSLDEPPEAAEFKEISCKALAKAGMELRKWNVLGQSDAKESKVLGLHWSLEADELCIAIPSVDDQPDVWTRRSLMQRVAEFFDPMGIGAALLLTGKILLQQTCKAGTDWDDPLPTPLNESIRAWWGVALQLPKMQMIQLFFRYIYYYYIFIRFIRCMPPVLMLRPMVGGAGCNPPTPYFLICAVLALARGEHLKLSTV